MGKAIDKLDEITTQIQFLNKLVKDRSSGLIEYKTVIGTAIGYALFKIDTVAVQRVFLSSGTVFPIHVHAEKEWMMVYQGSMTFNFGKIESREEDLKDEKICNPGDYVYFDSYIPHSAIVHKDSWIIAVTIPAERNYPNVSHK